MLLDKIYIGSALANIVSEEFKEGTNLKPTDLCIISNSLSETLDETKNDLIDIMQALYGADA